MNWMDDFRFPPEQVPGSRLPVVGSDRSPNRPASSASSAVNASSSWMPPDWFAAERQVRTARRNDVQLRMRVILLAPRRWVAHNSDGITLLLAIIGSLLATWLITAVWK